MKVVYIDILFLINAAANYLILLATAKICDVSASRIAMAVSAAAGGIYAVFAAVPKFGFLNLLPVKLSAGILMLLVVFRRKTGFLRICIVFLAVSAAFGGVLYSLEAGGVHMGLKAAAAVFAAAWAAVSLVFRRTGKAGGISTVRLDISCFGRELCCTALVDTGNCLKDPVTGLGAAIVSPEKLYELFPPELAGRISGKPPAEAMLALSSTGYSGRFRLLPYSAVGVKGGMLLALRPDSLKVNGTAVPGMLAAISPTAVSDGGSYSALVGADTKYCRR